MKHAVVVLLFGVVLCSLFTAIVWGAPGMSGDPVNGTTDEEGLTNSTSPPPAPLLGDSQKPFFQSMHVWNGIIQI